MFSSLKKLTGYDKTQQMMQAWYIACVTQARHPYFYASLHVPDTLDGRFEMVLLHLYILLARAENVLSDDEKRVLVEIFFADMERNIREFGIDMGMKKRIRAMADAYNGRMRAYAEASATTGDAALQEALLRNIYGTTPPADAASGEALAAYLRASLAQPVARGAAVSWPVLPA